MPIAVCFNWHMLDELRSQLIAQGASNTTLRKFESAIREQASEPLKKKVERAEMRSLEHSEAENVWRIKYLKVLDEKIALEHTIVLREGRLEAALRATKNLSAYIKKLRAEIFAASSERRPVPILEPNDEKPKRARGKQRGSKGFGRKPDANLPEEPVPHDLSDDQTHCPCGAEYDLVDLPPETSEETHISEKLVKRKHIRRKAIRKCSSCGHNGGIVTAAKPSSVIPKSKYSSQFWRFLLEEKYWLQRPTNRSLRKLKALGATTQASTLNNGFRILHEAGIFQPIYDAIVDRSRLVELRRMDETGWKVFAVSEGKDSSRWYMWVSVTDDTTVFILDPSKSNEVIRAHLDGVAEGIILCDRAKSYQCFARKNPGFLIAFCWVHQRRDFVGLQTGFPQHSRWADEWLTRIDAIILQNRLRLNASTDADFKAEDKAIRKMIKKFERKFEEQLTNKTLEEEQLACLRSLREHWSGLTVFVNFPHVPMSNNEAERALRNAVLGRKSYYGSRAVWAGMQASFLFTIYSTLEQNKINPIIWMDEYLTACAENKGLPPPDKVLKKFLPWNYKSTSSQEPVVADYKDLRVSLLPALEPVSV